MRVGLSAVDQNNERISEILNLLRIRIGFGKMQPGGGCNAFGIVTRAAVRFLQNGVKGGAEIDALRAQRRAAQNPQNQPFKQEYSSWGKASTPDIK
jgi:hypothetical protein